MNEIKDFIATQSAPFYVYSKAQIIENIKTLKDTLCGAEIIFSVKANPFPPVIELLAQSGIGTDAASQNEVWLSLKSGIKPQNVYYSASGKTQEDIEKAAGNCTIIADSLTELKAINAYAVKCKKTLEVGLRINPLFSMFSSTGDSSKFGVDEELIAENAALFKELSNIKIIGVHVHVRSQVLDAKTLVTYYNNVYNMAVGLNNQPAFDIQFINFGGGLGVQYSKADEKPLDFETVKKGFAELTKKNSNELKAHFIVETGRFLLCNSGTFVTEIVDIKTSRGKKYLVARNGLNGFVRASMRDIFASVPVAPSFGAEPLYTSQNAFEISLLTDEVATETVDLCGNLCTAIDTLGKGITLPKAKIGDKVLVSNAGSYAYTLTPLLFSSHTLPKEYLV